MSNKKPDHISHKDWDEVDSPEWTPEDFARAQPVFCDEHFRRCGFWSKQDEKEAERRQS